jgi:hypothetical protein
VFFDRPVTAAVDYDLRAGRDESGTTSAIFWPVRRLT